VARNIDDYLASGDALRLSDANSALDSLARTGPCRLSWPKNCAPAWT
jgi:hypothetical protein